MMVTANDYIDRRVDLLVLHGGEVSTSPQLLEHALALPETGGTITAGLQKLALRVYLELLQDVGSEPYFPNRGCGYLRELRSGTVQTVAGLLNTFARGAWQVQRTLINEESNDDPDDERLAAITPLNAVLDGDRAAVSFRVTSLAGESAVYLMPANFTI